jgi:hypothetical protein
MSESPEARARRRWINLGELIALAALIVSGLGVWIAWKSSNQERTTRIVEQHHPVPLSLRATIDEDGRALTLVPADSSHALESATLTIKGAAPIEVGSDGRLSASDIESALKGREKQDKDVAYNLPVRITARYVENGADRRGGGLYVLRYKWEGGGLFGGRSIRMLGLSKA